MISGILGPTVASLCERSRERVAEVASGLPHRVVADDEYNGYVLPGGGTIVVNVWFVHN